MSHPDIRVLRAISSPEFPDEIQRTLNAAWADHAEVPDVIRGDIAVAASEVGTNIMQHATAGQEVAIEMELQVLGDEVRITFTDDGLPARIDPASVHMPDDLAESGRGLALARAILRELSYHRDEHGNHWVLVSERFR